MTEQTYSKKSNAQRAAERMSAKTGNSYKIEAVERRCAAAAVGADTAATGQACGPSGRRIIH